MLIVTGLESDNATNVSRDASGGLSASTTYWDLSTRTGKRRKQPVKYLAKAGSRVYHDLQSGKPYISGRGTFVAWFASCNQAWTEDPHSVVEEVPADRRLCKFCEKRRQRKESSNGK